jgi:hypothetical protein
LCSADRASPCGGDYDLSFLLQGGTTPFIRA